VNETLRTIELGHAYTRTELLNHFRAVWGGVSFPGRRPGFACVLAMDYEPHLDSYDIFLLDEYESFDLRELIRQCRILDLRYSIQLERSYNPNSLNRWLGDDKNDAASRFIVEMNTESRNDPAKHTVRFALSATAILEMENLYSYILPQIKDLLTAERRQLFLKGSKIVGYLSEIEDAQISELEFGAYPAIESLAFAVIELRDAIEQENKIPEKPYRYDFDPLNLSNL